MDYKVLMYLLYLAISVGLTVWVGTTLSRNGLVFLEDVFGDLRLARAVNHLLVVGFYLVNLGYVSFTLRTGDSIDSAALVLESLSRKVGGVLLVLGGLHLVNVFALGRYRRSRQRQQAAQQAAQPSGLPPAAVSHLTPSQSTPTHPEQGQPSGTHSSGWPAP